MTAPRTARGILALGVVLVSLCAAGCASTTPQVTDSLTAAEYFQRAQDAADSSNDKLAIAYYQMFQDKYPDDTYHQAWAQYEIAFLYHKMGNDKKAKELFQQLLDRYAQDQGLPDAPKILAQKVMTGLQAATLPTKQGS